MQTLPQPDLLARISGQSAWQYAEGFRQHSHVGFSTCDRNLLADVLGDRVRQGS